MSSTLIADPRLTGESFQITPDGQAPTQINNFNVVASTITVAAAGITPVASDLFAGESATDIVNFATFKSQPNYETDFPGGAILPIEVIIDVGISQPGSYDETTPFAEDDLVTVTFRVPDSNGSFEDFVIGPIAVQGVVTPPPVATGAPFTLRQNMIDLPDAPTDFEITSVPATKARFYKRSDGRLGADLTDLQLPVDLTVNYNDLTTGSPVAKSVTIQPQLGFERFGWGPGDFYMPQLDATDRSVWQPNRIWQRTIHMANDGLTRQDCTDREGENWTASKFINRAATLGGDLPGADGVLKYGETPELALTEDAAKLYWQELGKQKGAGNYQLLFKVGDTFNFWSGGGGREMRGWSPLHPIRIGTYGGAGAATIRSLPAYDNCIVQGNFRVTGKTETDGVKYYLWEDIVFLAQPSFSQGRRRCGKMTLRRYACYDIYPRTPDPQNNNPGIWDVKGPHVVGTYIGGFSGVLIEHCFQDLVGWALFYDENGDITAPYPVNEFCHNIYVDGGNSDITVRYSGFGRASLTTYQGRCGGYWYGNFAMGANQQMLMAEGKNGDAINGHDGNYALLEDSTFTWAGQKAENVGTRSMNSALGLRNKSFEWSDYNCVIMHSGAPPVFAIDGAHPDPQNDNSYNHKDGSLYRSNLLVYKWTDKPDENIGGLDPAILDATTIEAYHDQWKGVTGSHRNDLIASLRALDEPWVQTAHMNDWFLGRTGRAKPVRTVAQTMVFEPEANGETSGRRWDERRNWSSATYPGIVPGDSVDINGYYVFGFDQPLYPLVDLFLGDGQLTRFGGLLELTGNIVESGEIILKNSGQLFMGGGNVAAGVDMKLEIAGRFANTGSIVFDGDIHVSGRSELIFGLGDGDAFTMNGDLTVSGQAYAIFDGAGGAASLILNGTTTFNPVARFRCDTSVQPGNREFRQGTVVTGATSGFTGVIEYLDYMGNIDEFCMHVRITSGTPQNGEDLNADVWFGNLDGQFDLGYGRIGRIISEPEYIMGRIREFTSGIHGTVASNIASTVALGGVLVVDERNLLPGTYTLIAADTITGAFASQPPNVSVTTTAVILTVT